MIDKQSNDKPANVPDMEIIVYAFDILLMASGNTHEATLSVLLKSLQMTNDWCTANKLTISRDKTSIMPMHIRKRDIYRSHHMGYKFGYAHEVPRSNIR